MSSANPRRADIIRHFTASGYVVHQGCVLFHWHPKVCGLLPPGGHIEANEDPVEAVLREIKEETGLEVEVVSSVLPLDVKYPIQVAPPETIMVEDINDPEIGPHQHIDMIYFCQLVGPVEKLKDGWHWIDETSLVECIPINQTVVGTVVPAEDVRALALRALRRARNVL